VQNNGETERGRLKVMWKSGIGKVNHGEEDKRMILHCTFKN
jgi:hypothetical protein